MRQRPLHEPHARPDRPADDPSIADYRSKMALTVDNLSIVLEKTGRTARRNGATAVSWTCGRA